MTRNATGLWSRPDFDDVDQVRLPLTELLHPALAAAGVGVWRFESDRRCFYFDPLLREIYQLPESGTLSFDQVRRCIHPDDQEAWSSLFAGEFPSVTLRSRHRIVLADGAVRWLDWTGPDSESPGGVVFGVCVDVSNEILVQRQLRSEQERFRAIASGVPGKFCYMDADLNVRMLSKEFCEFLEVDQQTILDKPAAEIFGADDVAERRPFLDRALEGTTTSFEDTSEGTDGSIVYETVTYRPDIDENGTVRGLFTLRVDVTHLRQLEDELRAKSQDLERSNADLEQFAYVASHDLKAPLRAIQVLVGWLREDLADYSEGDVQENLSLLEQRCVRLTRLLEDLLCYSRAGRDTDPPKSIELGELVNEIADLIDAEHDIAISMTGDPLTLFSDPAAIHLVLRNLIGNAVKHHPGPSGSVRVYAEDQGTHHLINIADDGAGIPKEFSEKVFKMFQTLKPRDEVEGSGMGLAIVERTVRNQGGKIWFEPAEQGSGTVFKFTWTKRFDSPTGAQQ